MFKKKKKFSPIVTFILLTFITIILSGFLSLLNVQTEYSTVNKDRLYLTYKGITTYEGVIVSNRYNPIAIADKNRLGVNIKLCEG